ncbi:MAG: ribosome biogenesis GTP-binding protein YihA/YsxC [Microthrixaceae bacterium]
MKSKPLQLDFVTSAPSAAELPDAIADLAVVGRSNVGKSSLINALANRKQLAAVSGTPGRTRLLNAFRLQEGPEPRPLLVDLPGYGYAKVPRAVKDTWGPMIEGYLTTRDDLAMVAVLLDGEVGPTKSDLELLDWLRHELIPHSVIATKHDKVKSSKRDKRRKELAARCDLEPRDVLWVSATKGVNIDLLRERVRTWLLG